jgi:hypothetical protein
MFNIKAICQISPAGPKNGHPNTHLSADISRFNCFTITNRHCISQDGGDPFNRHHPGRVGGGKAAA